MSRHLVAALAYDQLCTFEFGCVVEVFGIQRPELGVPWYDFAVHPVDHGPIRAVGGLTLRVDAIPDLLARADTIVVPGWRGIDAPVPERLVAQLRSAHERGARLCSICSGVFVLAACGLLDGRTVTTHWRFADLLARRYPSVTVQPNALYVDEGCIITAAGSAAGLDMLMHVVRKDHGVKVANRVAQRLVISPHREGGQAQFVPRLLEPEDGGRINALMTWVRGNLREPHSMAMWAGRATVSQRTLQRHFREVTGMSPQEWLIHERIAQARDLLEISRLRMAQIVDTVGFGSEESFRRHFRRIVGISPQAYQRQFNPV